MQRMNYQIAAKITVQHRYYTNGDCPDLELIPTAETQRILQRHQLKFQKNASLYQVFAQATNEDDEVKKLNCYFIIKVHHPLFINFTNLPLTKKNSGKYYFSSNATTDSRLTQTEVVSAADQWTFYPKVFRYPLSSPTTEAGLFIIKNKRGEIVEQQSVAAEVTEMMLDLQHLNEGCYTAHWNDEMLDAPFFIGQPLGLTDLGIIEIEVKTPVLAQQNDVADYSIIFDNRATFWCYYLINSHNYPLGNFKIKANNGQSNNQFLDTSEVQLSNGAMAQTLTSERPIPLVQQTKTTFKLSMNKIVREQVSGIPRTIDLPIADINRIKPMPQADGSVRMTSDVYVYL